MSPPSVISPTAVSAVSGGDLYSITKWADEQRAELAYLASECRALRADADAAEYELTLETSDLSADPPPDFIAVIGTMLEAATAQLDANVRRVCADAESTVNRAKTEAQRLQQVPIKQVPLDSTGTDIDAFLAQPTACDDGKFDLRETFWGDLYNQQGFSPLRRFARSEL